MFNFNQYFFLMLTVIKSYEIIYPYNLDRKIIFYSCTFPQAKLFNSNVTKYKK